jgi:riboflavin kinase/FMN adenylyltransferase
MQVFHGHLDAARNLPRGGAVALGNFDGVHLGHRELVARVKAHARRSGGPAVVLTFEPHPTRVLAPQAAPPLIIPLDHRLALLDALGVDAVLLEPFTPAFSMIPAATFVRDVLVDALEVRAVVVGWNFRFGHQRAGTPELLLELGTRHGFAVDVVQEVVAGTIPVSSSRVRQLITDGDVATVQHLLGRPFSVRGTVVHGQHRGRTLGFPTANVESAVELLPARGVYAARVSSLDGGPLRQHPAVVNVGVNPTFGGTRVTVEAHLLDHAADLYGQHLEVAFTQRLRAEQKFDGVEALRTQITRDAARARELLATA